jgi:hypothetical protein
MSDRVVRIYLYVLIGSNVVSALLWVTFWFAQSHRPRHPLVKPKYHWRQLFSLVTGLLGWYLFSMRVFSNSVILVVTFVMLLVGFYFAELLGGSLERGGNKHAT